MSLPAPCCSQKGSPRRGKYIYCRAQPSNNAGKTYFVGTYYPGKKNTLWEFSRDHTFSSKLQGNLIHWECINEVRLYRKNFVVFQMTKLQKKHQSQYKAFSKKLIICNKTHLYWTRVYRVMPHGPAHIPYVTWTQRWCGRPSHPLNVVKTIPIRERRIDVLTQLVETPESCAAIICTERY